MFTLDDPYFRHANLPFGFKALDMHPPYEFLVTISGSGEGTVEIGATTSSAEDTGGQSDFSIDDPASGGTVPRLEPGGTHGCGSLHLSRRGPFKTFHDGISYKAGEAIDLLFVATRYVPDETSIPQEACSGWAAGQSTGALPGLWDQSLFQRGSTTLIYSYEVQPGDSDTDGILLGENPLGRNANYDTVDCHSRTPVDLHLPAMQLACRPGS